MSKKSYFPVLAFLCLKLLLLDWGTFSTYKGSFWCKEKINEWRKNEEYFDIEEEKWKIDKVIIILFFVYHIFEMQNQKL